MKIKQARIDGLKLLVSLFLGFLLFFSISRVALFGTYWQRVKEAGVRTELSFLYGIRMDIMAISIFFVIPIILYFWTPGRFKVQVNHLLKLYIFGIFMIFLYIEMASFPFFEEYDCRPNEMFINYLVYPREIILTIWGTHRFALFISSFILATLLFVFVKYYNRVSFEISGGTLWRRSFGFLTCLVLLFLGVRSSLGHRPANLTDAAFSSSHLVNEITKNSLYSLGYTIYARMKYSTDVKLYGSMPIDQALARVKARLALSDCDENIPFMRDEVTHFPRTKPKNLVIILEESLGSQFVESYGGVAGLTPHLDELSATGLAFKNLYATGTRSVRGMEAVVAGFLPVPGESVLKRNKAQKGFFTLAQALKPLGYRASFIYGGEKRFDNMGRWYSGNGFDTVIDEKDFENPIFRGTWGVCDEDLFIKANDYFEDLHAQGEPFVSVVFTTSFHVPYEYPAGRLEDEDPVDEDPVDEDPVDEVANAVRYADYSLGQFFKKAKTSDYYKDTIFLVIADHDARVMGDKLIPIEHYKIPGFILGEDVPVQDIDSLLSQPDAIATALDFLGVPLSHPILGRSIYDSLNNFALMQYYDTYALLTPTQVAIVQPGKSPQTYRRIPGNMDQYEPTATNKELENDLLALLTSTSYLYENYLHRPKDQKGSVEQKLSLK